MVFGIVALVLLLLTAVVLIIAVMLSPSKSAGLSGALTGSSAETFFGKNRAKSLEGKLDTIIKVSAASVFALSLALVLIIRYTTWF